MGKGAELMSVFLSFPPKFIFLRQVGNARADTFPHGVRWFKALTPALALSLLPF